MTVLALDRVSKRFGTVAALSEVCIEVSRGSIVSLLGPSGCGKTTTLRLIAGFEDPDSGTIHINGRSVVGLRPYERNVGLVFQDYALFPHMTVRENIAYGLRRRRIVTSSIPQRVDRHLELVQMTGMDDRFPRQLSGGQQQRVALARALCTEPEVLLLDEPLSALDAKLRAELQVDLKVILRDAGCTAIIVTHDQDEAMSLGDEVMVMNHGSIVQRGTPADIYDRPANKFVAEFVGRSNWFAGDIVSRSLNGNSILRTEDGLELEIAATVDTLEKSSVCVRPERVSILDEGISGTSVATNSFSAVIQEVVHLGGIVNIYLTLHGGRRILATKPNDGVQMNRHDRKVVRFSANDCHLLHDSN